MLLRADSLWLHPLVAMLAVSGKFLLRIRGKHVFNPANFGVGVALGATVATRAHRDDAAWLFLEVFLGLTAARLFVLGYPLERAWEIWSHQALNGALLLFAFFMNSDPMTLPDRPAARRMHVVLVALAAFIWQFLLYRPSGALWALLLAPLWDAIWLGRSRRWAEPVHLLDVLNSIIRR